MYVNSKETTMAVHSSSIISLRTAILVAICLQNAGYTLLRKYSTMTQRVSSKEILLVSEIIKVNYLWINCFVLFTNCDWPFRPILRFMKIVSYLFILIQTCIAIKIFIFISIYLLYFIMYIYRYIYFKLKFCYSIIIFLMTYLNLLSISDLGHHRHLSNSSRRRGDKCAGPRLCKASLVDCP